MGIQGLLPFLKKIHEPVNVSRFAGCTVAIDAYCWLHKGAFSCAEKLALGEKTDQYVFYCMKFINYLLAHNIKPVMVLDGCNLPSKKQVEKTRREKRDANRKKAAQFLREGRRAEARECLQRSIDITPEMALNLMNVCRDKGVDCIVAPYEADSQLAYLNKIGIADVIITEDSDLLLFGCEKVLFKMDHAGNGLLIEKRRLNEVVEIQTDSYTFDKFRYMCIMSGCDYLASLPGIGLARANKVFKIARQPDIQMLLKKLSTYLKSNITVPEEYIKGFVQADNTFLYQLVFDPLQRKLVPLTPYPPDIVPEDMPYAGQYVHKDTALQISLGNINIYSKQVFADFDPETFVPKYAKKSDMLYMRSIWDKHYRVKPKMVLHEAQLSDRPVLKGKEVTIKSNFKRHSPRKREREVEDSTDVKSDTELQSMYNDVVSQRKKPRLNSVGDELKRFMFASEDSPEEQNQSEEEKEEKPVVTGPTKSPKFFSSLSKAHPGIRDVDTSQESDVDKENGLKSPKRNIFATKSPKKPRFDLNAQKPKEVKSRFFANFSKKESSPVKSEKDSSLISGYRLVHQTSTDISGESDRTQCNTGSDDHHSNIDNSAPAKIPQGIDPPFSFSKEKLSDSQSSQNSSPGGAFKWSKFKFTGKSSPALKSPLTSSKLNKNFKKVVSESKLEDFLKSKCKDTKCSDTVRLKGDNSETQEDSLEEVTSQKLSSVHDSGLTSSQSASSLPYSIDSYCIDQTEIGSQISDSGSSCQNSQDSEKPKKHQGLSIYSMSTGKSELTEKKENASSKTECRDISWNSKHDEVNSDKTEDTKEDKDGGINQTKDIVFLIDSDDETETGSHRVTSQSNIRPTHTQNITKKGSVKPGCRVSGLSRRTNKKATTMDSRQQSLKDMFQKFAHKSSSRPKLIHDLDGEPTDASSPCTPEGATSLLQNRNETAQRKLLNI